MNPIVALIDRCLLGRKLKDYPGFDNFFSSGAEFLALKTELICVGNNLGEAKPRANQKLRLTAKPTTSASDAQHASLTWLSLTETHSNQHI